MSCLVRTAFQAAILAFTTATNSILSWSANACGMMNVDCRFHSNSRKSLQWAVDPYGTDIGTDCTVWFCAVRTVLNLQPGRSYLSPAPGGEYSTLPGPSQERPPSNNLEGLSKAVHDYGHHRPRNSVAIASERSSMAERSGQATELRLRNIGALGIPGIH
ncbi:hypothetical protein EDB89DRAFT_1905886 [Lactarius sanguifluus]|nr:hypothetical protein EDB89DRAFT_1905886 [Lactarius sanguifluus]